VRLDRGDTSPQSRGQYLLDLRQGAEAGVLALAYTVDGGGPQADRDRDRLVVVEQQRRQGAAAVELVAAGSARLGVDAVAELAKPVDVAAQGPVGDAEPFGELAAGPVAMRLQQGQQPQGHEWWDRSCRKRTGVLGQDLS
jgi:hypothetical protein